MVRRSRPRFATRLVRLLRASAPVTGTAPAVGAAGRHPFVGTVLHDAAPSPASSQASCSTICSGTSSVGATRVAPPAAGPSACHPTAYSSLINAPSCSPPAHSRVPVDAGQQEFTRVRPASALSRTLVRVHQFAANRVGDHRDALLDCLSYATDVLWPRPDHERGCLGCRD